MIIEILKIAGSGFLAVIYAFCLLNIGLLAGFGSGILERGQGLKNLVLGFLLGMALLGNFWLLYGLFLPFNRWLVIVVLGGSFICGWFWRREYVDWRRRLVDIGRRLRILDWEWRLVALTLAAVMLVFGLGALLIPPSGDDAEAFYMVLPKIIVHVGRVVAQPNYYGFSEIGFSGELHFAALMTLGGAEAATFFVWFVALATAGGVASLCSRMQAGEVGAIVAMVMLFSSTAFTNIVFYGNVNMFAAAYGMGAFMLVFDYIERGGRRSLVGAGLLAGTAVVAKFSYIPVLIPSIGLMVILREMLENKSPKEAITDVVKVCPLLAVPFILAIVPHTIKNAVLFGEPFAPFYYFSGAQSWLDQSWSTPETVRQIFLTYPIALCYGKYSENLSPLLIILAPLALLGGRLRRGFFSHGNLPWHLCGIALVAIVSWSVLRPAVFAPRYILAPLLLLLPALATMVKSFLRQYPGERTIKRLMVMATLAALALACVENGFYRFPLMLRDGRIRGVEGRGTGLSYYSSCEFINQRLEKDGRVFFAGYYSFYLRPDILWNLQNPEDATALAGAASMEDKLRIMAERGFSYLLLQKATHGDAYVLDTIPAELADKVYEDPRAVVYKLRVNIRQD